MHSAHRRNAPVRVPSAVLIELYRGHGTDEPIDALLADAGAGREVAIDALAVATAIRLGGGIVATHDPDDLRRLAGGHSNVSILEI